MGPRLPDRTPAPCGEYHGPRTACQACREETYTQDQERENTTMTKLTAKQELQRAQVVEKICKLDNTSEDIAQFGPRVLEIFRGVSVNVWWDIDDAIGNGEPEFGGKGWLVRRVRNSQEYGPALFKALRRGR